MLDEGAIMPVRAHETDAGIDLFSRETTEIMPHHSQVFDTGVHVELPPGTVGMIKSKSGLNVKFGLVSEGVIDEGYTGSVVVKIYNHSDDVYVVNKGDKLTQLVVIPVMYVDLELVDELDKTDRGNNGFGSTGM